MIMTSFQRVKYEDMNACQKEIFNFQKVSSVFADFGFATYRLTDDWNGADFLAVHFDGIYSYPVPPKYLEKKLEKYCLGRESSPMG